MNWLETMSPMWVDWRKKIMKFSYTNTEVTLTGILETATDCKQMSAHELKGLLQTDVVDHIIQLYHISDTIPQSEIVPEEVQKLLAEHKELFSEPTSLPP